MEEQEESKKKYKNAWRYVLGVEGQRNEHQLLAFEYLEDIIRGR